MRQSPQNKEPIAYNTKPWGGEFGDLGPVVGGTGKFAGDTGRIRISVTLNFVDASRVNYEGEVCRP